MKTKKAKMKKKTKITILLASLGTLALLIAAAIIFYSVYAASPLPMAERFRRAVEENDSVAFYDCIDPDARISVRRFQMVTGASLSRLVQYATNTTEYNTEEKISYRLTDYRRTGDSAVLTLRASSADGHEWDATLSTVRRGGIWYVAVKSADAS